MTADARMVFLGIDLGWISQPTGLATMDEDAGRPRLQTLARCATHADVLAWIDEQVSSGPAMLAIDAPLVIPNLSGIRLCERLVNAEFRRYHAGCHAAHQGRPFYTGMARLVEALRQRGFQHAPEVVPGHPARLMIEVHPHAASVSLFGLEQIIKYKKGRVAERSRELSRFRELLSGLLSCELPEIPTRGPALKAVEDQLDAALAAYVGWLWWRHGSGRSRCYGDEGSGYIVIPRPLFGVA
jgi:predicted RNase H-like nuclease